MSIIKPKDLIAARKFFLEPSNPKQRQYEAIRAYYLDGLTGEQAAAKFGYTHGSFRQLLHTFVNDAEQQFFNTPKHGPQAQSKKDPARETIIALRKQNYSVSEISEALKDAGIKLSAMAVDEVLKSEGFAPLPRRSLRERPDRPRPNVEAVSDVRSFNIPDGVEFNTVCGGLFLFLPDLIRLHVSEMAKQANLPGSKKIPAEQALLACLALKLWSIERKSHVMSLVADPGLALFAGLNVFPKKSYLSEYSSTIEHKMVLKMLSSWHGHTKSEGLFAEASFNLDFHSVPFYGADEIIEKHYVSMRSRSQPSVLVFLAQDVENRAFCYSNADIRKGEENDEILRFISFWKSVTGKNPEHLVFDSKLTTYANLAKIDEMKIPFITLRRRHSTLLAEVDGLPASAWRKVELDVPGRKFDSPKYIERKVTLAGRQFRQLFVKDLGHDEPTIILTNDTKTPKQLILRYALRMLIENSLSDAVRFFHMDALSSAVALKVDFDIALLVLASGLYRILAQRMRGYSTAQARQIFRDIIDIPATVTTSAETVTVKFHRRSHLPIIAASGLLNQPIEVPWWDGRRLVLTA
jgi:transposase